MSTKKTRVFIPKNQRVDTFKTGNSNKWLPIFQDAWSLKGSEVEEEDDDDDCDDDDDDDNDVDADDDDDDNDDDYDDDVDDNMEN